MTDDRRLTQNEPSGDRGGRADRSRQSVWGLPPQWRVYFLIIFTLKMSVWTGLVVRHELAHGDHAMGMDLAMAAVDRISAAMPLFGFTTILMLEIGAGVMITYNYLYNKIVQPVIDGHIEVGLERGLEQGRAEGIAEGRAEGEAAGEARMRAQFVEWLIRKADAERLGVPFDEPMPGGDIGVNGHAPQK